MKRYLKFASLLLISNLLFGFGAYASFEILKNKGDMFIDPINANEKNR